MLQPVLAPEVNLSKEAFFYDSLHKQLYFLHHGTLKKRDLNSQQQQTISISLSAIQRAPNSVPQLISSSENFIINIDRNVVTVNNEQPAIVRGSCEVIDGSHWEWHLPLTLQGVQLGICRIKQNGLQQTDLISFNSSTARTVSFAYRGGELAFWVNGTPPLKLASKTIEIKLPKEKIYPCASLKGKGSVAAFIPFFSQPNLLGISQFNPFGKLCSQTPQVVQPQPLESNNLKISKLIQLSNDRFLIIWQNNKSRIYYRSQKTLKFDFQTLAVVGTTVSNLFSQSEYALIKAWRGNQPLFPEYKFHALQNIFEWIKYLISQLDQQASQRTDLYEIFLSKLVNLRPYLSSLALRIPNFIIQNEADREAYSLAFKYFNFQKDNQPFSIVKTFQEMIIEGELKEFTENYLLTQQQNTLIFYYVGDVIKQVFRFTIQPQKAYSKRDSLEKYQESDLRYLKSQGTFLFKILMSCLNKEKKVQEIHSVNQHDVKQLVKDFGINQETAKAALERTGNVQEALVWIYTQKQHESLKNLVNSKDQTNNVKNSISLIELKSMFGRLLFLINSDLFILGMIPCQLKKWIHRGQNEYVDLSTFKHQSSLEDIYVESWFKGKNHPNLTILDRFSSPDSPLTLFQYNNRIYEFYTNQSGHFRRQIKLNFENIYEIQSSITLQNNSQPIDLLQNRIIKTTNSELVTVDSLKQALLPRTNLLINDKLYTNNTIRHQKCLQIVIESKQPFLNLQSINQENIPLLVQTGPPGINKNYSISNILLPRSKFLANYPHGFTLRHLHNKVMCVSTFCLRRSLCQKNINYITEGSVSFKDIWGRKSQQYEFKFGQADYWVKIQLPKVDYWSQINVTAKYTTQKKLPFEIGSITVTGESISKQTYRNMYYQQLTKLTARLNAKLSILSFRPISLNAIQLQVTSPQLSLLESALTSANIKIQKRTNSDSQDSLKSLDIQQPYQVISKIVSDLSNKENILRHLANSHLFNLKHFNQSQVCKFVDLVFFYGKNIQNTHFYEKIFNKIWQNQIGKSYLNRLANALTQVPILALPFLKLLIKKLNSNQLQLGIKSALKAISSKKSPNYSKVKQNQQTYLYYEAQFYSDYYYELIDPTPVQKQTCLFTEPVIKSQIAVFKSDFTRRHIIKLPSLHHISDCILKVERCEALSKCNFIVYALDGNKKKLVGSGRIFEHQWAQVTRFSSKSYIQEAFGSASKNFNSIGLNIPEFTAQYIEIQLNFTETGIICHQNQSLKVPQIDILPELYGFETGKSVQIALYDWIFNNKPQDMFFLSVSTLGKLPMQKFSVTKNKNIEFLYYCIQTEDLGLIKKTLQQKIEKHQYDPIVTLQKKLIKNGAFSHKISLDYLYTLFILILEQLQKRGEKLEESVCDQIYNSIVIATQGPIKIAGFKALSHKIPLLLKSLQYIQSQLPSLGAISFSYEQLLQVLDFNNCELCKSLSRLILRGVAYEQKWVELLIKISQLTQNHGQIIKYFIDKEDWLQNVIVLDYVFKLPEEIFVNEFLESIAYKQLCKLVLTPNAKSSLQLLLQVIVERASASNPVDLDVVSLLFQQQQVRWEQLQRVIVCYPEATDIVIHQYLQTDTPEKLASNHQILLTTAAQTKYAEEFSDFLDKIYKKNKIALGEIFLSLIGKCTSLHYDFLETIINFIVDLCDFGGVQGVVLVTQSGLVNLNAAVQMLKVVQKLPEGAELQSEDSLIQWYLRNNDYQFTNGNPANKSAGYQLMRNLVQQVLSLLKYSSPVKVLNKYTSEIKLVKQSRKSSLIKRHLLFNQIHHGATQLLSHTLTPGSLAQVLVGSQNPLLSTVINELKATAIKKSSKGDKWKPNKQIDITEKFVVVSENANEVKDIQLGKAGSKAPAYKIFTHQKSIKMLAQQVQHPSKFVIGFALNDHAENKTSILPSKVQLISGNGKANMKVGEMSLLQDQHFLQYGVKVFGLNLNSLDSLTINSIKSLQFRLHEPNFASVSDLLQSGQKFKKGATYSISFVGIFGYDQQPVIQPDYSHLYVTLLGFLGQKKYQKDLQAVIKSPQFDQKLQLIIQVLNDLLPNEQIQNLLLALNRQGQNILQHILRSKGANPRLISMLVLGRLTKDSINKLIAYTLENLSSQYVSIVVQGLRLASYSIQTKQAQGISNFENLKLLIEKWEKAQGQPKDLYFRLLSSITTVPNIFNYEVAKLVQFIWNKSDRQKYYLLLAAILPYYPIQLRSIAISGYTERLFDQLSVILKTNQGAPSIIADPYNHVALLSTLTIQSTSKTLLLEKKVPIKLLQLLKSESSLLVKYESKTIKLFINFFQSTCIGTNCQEEFGEILISLMTSLNDFNPSHHHYFIHSFFFPLINAFKGVPIIFVWKYGKSYLKQINDIFKENPIKSSMNVLKYQDDFYHLIETLDANNLSQTILFLQKDSKKAVYKLVDGALLDVVSNRNRKFTSNQGKILVELDGGQTLEISNEKYSAYQLNEWEKYLLTNATLLNLDNPWILEESYRSVLPIQQSTPQRCYFVPLQMNLSHIIQRINIGGLTISSADIQKIVLSNRQNGKQLTPSSTFKEIIESQEQNFVKIEVQASNLFNHTTIESLAKENLLKQPFVAQQTIYKAFQEKKGLEKMITVLKGCVKNWVNAEQCNIWGQYLRQLESYSCFPVFSSLYMTKQNNVSLLFDLLLGLPDKQDNKKWLQKQKESVKELYLIIKDVFAVKGENAKVVRQYALKSGFYSTMLDRLHLITKQTKRYKNEQDKIEEQQVLPVFEKKISEQQAKQTLTKKKGVGYGTDSSTNQKWDLTGHQQARKEQSDQVLGLLKILQQFLDYQGFEYPPQLLNQTLQSSLLPIIESSLRGGSLLQISKYAQLFQGELSFIQIIAKCKNLVPTLMPIPKYYEPKQIQSIHSLLKTLANTCKIFLSCLTGSASQKVSQQIAKKTIQTFEIIEEAIESYEIIHNDQQDDKKILELPLAKKYPLLLKDLRFDYIDMKEGAGKITKHHYSSSYQAGHKPPVEKTIRLAQQLADISHALPIDHTNAIYVRCDKERVDFMQALIMGSNGTPYGHGAYLFDIHFEDNYPNGPPKVNLTTTGNGQIRFNPNLYACGKVCLSLLGTWRGSASENWDPKVSTLLQVLVSIQSIIMSEDIYFNEPGFEHQQGTPEGQQKNEAYANIVRYGNIKFAMIDNIKNPPKGFESIIRRHFYLKKEEILQQCRKWLKLAQKREASYNGLVNDHNYNWCNNFKKSKTQYKTMLEKAFKELQVQLRKLPPPTNEDFKKEASQAKQKKKALKKQKINSNQQQIEEIDVSYGGAKQFQELDINDQRVKDRWSRYIGAMGVEAVSKQSRANILILGLGPLGVQIAKNIVLSGCGELGLWDDKIVDWADLSGQFFLGENQVGHSRLDSTFYKLQQLNHYVRLSKFDYNASEFSGISRFQVVIATQRNQEELIKLDAFCRSNKIHFLAADCYGPYGQIFNDFGDNFEVLDKNGEETIEVLIDQITIAQKGLVKLPKNQRHPYQDGQAIRISGVKGMKSLVNEAVSINETLHKIRVIDQNSFEIGDTTSYAPYQGDGVARNLKTPTIYSFKSLQASSKLKNIDSNLELYDWAKSGKLRLLHTIFIALSKFRQQNNRLPLAWNKQDAQKLIEIVKKSQAQLKEDQLKYIRLFSYTCSGNLGPICAFFGGIAAQQAFKAITGKYAPISQYFLAEFSQIIETPPEEEQAWSEFVGNYSTVTDRSEGLRRIIGLDLLKKLENSRVFMVGSGAIGCQLLKNFAMLEIGAGENGNIVVTDPDHIENSNLNRQFLFREKHIRKPKSATAIAAVCQMNPRLKGHTKARLDKVCAATKEIFTNEFFESQTIIANALDNVEARRYIDGRCVQNKVPLLESGTLSSKGHVQVIIPFKTQTYGSKQDPNDSQGDIPQCTLKMFPEETVHCVEWARDLFGKQFTLGPKALHKLLSQGQKYVPNPSDIAMLKDCLKLIERRPSTFDDAIQAATKLFYQVFRNDILQLLYTYPLDAKTKDGKLFWKLPKRPPTSIDQILPEDPLHATFITSFSVLLARVYNIPYPKDFRDPKKREQVAKMASKMKVEPFVASDKLALQMASQVNKQAAHQSESKEQNEQNQQKQNQESETAIYNRFLSILQEIKENGEAIESKPQQFEKDEDQNGHIDLIYSMANLRARNYKLQEMEWIAVKLKAGRIMPALSTTTSCIAALQTIQLIKYLKGCPLEAMRNAFINLAVPYMQLGQPGPVQKIKVHPNLQTTLWERWSIGPVSSSKTLGQFMNLIEQKYGVIVKGLSFAEGNQIYSDFVMSLESKKDQKAKLLNKSLQAILSEQFGEQVGKFTDFTLVMGVGQTLIKHAPTLRLLLES